MYSEYTCEAVFTETQILKSLLDTITGKLEKYKFSNVFVTTLLILLHLAVEWNKPEVGLSLQACITSNNLHPHHPSHTSKAFYLQLFLPAHHHYMINIPFPPPSSPFFTHSEAAMHVPVSPVV